MQLHPIQKSISKDVSWNIRTSRIEISPPPSDAALVGGGRWYFFATFWQWHGWRLDMLATLLKRCRTECGQLTSIAIILKVPQKFEIGNHMLSLTHHTNSRWTTALLAGESIVEALPHAQHTAPETLGRFSPCAIIREYLTRSPRLWNYPLTLLCIILTDHLRRAQSYSARDLTQSVMSIEEQLGVTRVGRRGNGPISRSVRGVMGTEGRPVQRTHAEHLTVEINTQVTRVRFTSASPRWNHEASVMIIGLAREFSRLMVQVPNSDDEIIGLLEHNINIARSLEDHVLGLQKRLELQLNVVCNATAGLSAQLTHCSSTVSWPKQITE